MWGRLRPRHGHPPGVCDAGSLPPSIPGGASLAVGTSPRGRSERRGGGIRVVRVAPGVSRAVAVGDHQWLVNSQTPGKISTRVFQGK